MRPLQVDTARRLALEWQAFVVRAYALRKVFVSVKGFYYQAEIMGQQVTWLVPHQLAQVRALLDELLDACAASLMAGCCWCTDADRLRGCVALLPARWLIKHVLESDHRIPGCVAPVMEMLAGNPAVLIEHLPSSCQC